MRQIKITFKQEGKELVACTADFGNRDEASELENKLADASQAAIATALRELPADLLAEGHGSTEQEAEQLAKVDTRPSLSRYRDTLKKIVPGLRIPLRRIG
jgi:capsular polysaccharide biosynthesis protein